MDKSIRISKSLLNVRIKANLLNLLILFVSVIVLYFGILYLIFGFGCGYLNQKKDIQEKEIYYNLQLKESASYQEYEQAIQKMYFEFFSDEICESYKKQYNKEYTITHIYNVVVLNLPEKPTYDNYKTSYHQYNQKEDGTFDVDRMALIIEGNGSYYEKNIHDLYYTSYKKMKSLLEEFDDSYYSLKMRTFNYEAYSRGIAFGLVFIFLFILFPILNKEGATFIEKKMGIAFVNIKNGYLCKKWKIILKNIFYMVFPLIGTILADKYSIIILTIGYLFLDHLIMLFSRNNLMLEEMIFRLEACSIQESLLFKNDKEERDYLESAEGTKIEDVDFVKKLETTREIQVIAENEKRRK